MRAQERVNSGKLTDRLHVIDTIDLVINERAVALRQLDNANRINREMAEAMAKVEKENRALKAEQTQRGAEVLDSILRQINDVVVKQHDLLADVGSIQRLADIRRRQVAKGYTPEHDDHEGEVALVNAAVALTMWRPSMWPRRPAHFDELYRDPDRLLHAAALLSAAQDVIDRKRKTEGNA